MSAPFKLLPKEIKHEVFKFCDAPALKSLHRVCKEFHHIIEWGTKSDNNIFYKVLYERFVIKDQNAAFYALTHVTKMFLPRKLKCAKYVTIIPNLKNDLTKAEMNRLLDFVPYDAKIKFDLKFIDKHAASSIISFASTNIDSYLLLLAVFTLESYKDGILYTQAILGDIALCLSLLSMGADINFKKDAGTVLSIACEEGHLKLVYRFLKAGADVTIPNKIGKTPLAIARQKNYTEIVEALMEYGAV